MLTTEDVECSIDDLQKLHFETSFITEVLSLLTVLTAFAFALIFVDVFHITANVTWL